MPTLGSGIGVMAAGTVSSADSNGDGIYLQNSSGVSLTLNGRAMPNAVQAAATPVAGNWAFVAGSIKSGVGTTAYVGGVGGTDVASANAKAVASRNIVLGTTLGYTSGSFQSIALPVAEFIIFGTRKLAADWPAIYARSKTRMSNAGLILS
ncbi:hypothetical protein DIE01_16290 [Burkholderia sp. Bp8990]|nr:hypothetical protein DIE01_16290 [Burkholderia sp. Bp8990]